MLVDLKLDWASSYSNPDGSTGLLAKQDLNFSRQHSLISRRRALQLGTGTLAGIISAGSLINKASAAEDLLLRVPYEQQDTPNGCARGTVSMALEAFGYPYRPNNKSLQRLVGENAHITNEVVPSFSKLTNNKLVGEHFTSKPDEWFENLRIALVDYRIPIITLIPFGTDIGWNFEAAHYIIVRGYSKNDQGVNIRFNDPWSPSKGIPREISASQFKRAWGNPGKSSARPYQGVFVYRLNEA